MVWFIVRIIFITLIVLYYYFTVNRFHCYNKQQNMTLDNQTLKINLYVCYYKQNIVVGNFSLKLKIVSVYRILYHSKLSGFYYLVITFGRHSLLEIFRTSSLTTNPYNYSKFLVQLNLLSS